MNRDLVSKSYWSKDCLTSYGSGRSSSFGYYLWLLDYEYIQHNRYIVTKYQSELKCYFETEIKLREIKKESEIIFIFNEESFIIIFIIEINKCDKINTPYIKSVLTKIENIEI